VYLALLTPILTSVVEIRNLNNNMAKAKQGKGKNTNKITEAKRTTRK